MVSFDSTDLDNAVSEDGVVHQNTANTDHNDASELKQGYDYANFSEITPTPVACYPLHEDSGTTANDLAGSNNGTYNGPTLGQNELLGTTAPSFDGADDYTETPVPIGPELNSFAFSVWIQTTSTTQSTATGVFNDDLTTAYQFRLNTDATGSESSDDLQLYIRDSTTPSSVSPALRVGTTGNATSFNDGSFHHLVFNVVDASNNSAEIWLDGTSLSLTFDQTDGPSSFNAFNYTPVVGARNVRGAIDRFTNAALADARFYSSSLSGTEIQTLYDVVATRGSLTTQSKTLQ